MKLILYFLIIVNIIILLFSWDNYGQDPRNSVLPDKQEGETLSLIDRQQIPARSLGQQAPSPKNPNSVARFIDRLLDFLSSLVSATLDIFRDDIHPLPPEPPSPPPPPRAAYCIDIGNYTSQSDATNFKDQLLVAGIKSSLQSKDIKTRSSQFVVIALVRAELDVAMELSQLLFENGIRNTVKKNDSIGYLLRSNVYRSKKTAQNVLNRIKELGMSAHLEETTKTIQSSKIYFLQVDRATVPQIEELPSNIRHQEGIQFSQNSAC